MSKASGLPNSFWEEVVATLVYMLNRCPMKNVKDMIPHKAWSGKKASVSHLKVFGYITYSCFQREATKLYFCWIY